MDRLNNGLRFLTFSEYKWSATGARAGDVLWIAQRVQKGLNLLSGVLHTYKREAFIRVRPDALLNLRQIKHSLEDLRLIAQQRLVDAKKDDASLVERQRGQDDVSVRNPMVSIAMRRGFRVGAHSGYGEVLGRGNVMLKDDGGDDEGVVGDSGFLKFQRLT